MADERQPATGREQGDENRDGRRRYFRRRQRPGGRSSREGDGPREGSTPREGGGARAGSTPREGGGAREQEQRNFRRRTPERRAPDSADTRNPRLGRRRRRTRSREGLTADQRPEVALQEVVDLDNYRTPSSVFIYTHVSRPGSGWDSYEFRAEHFSKGGRTLDDFDIDLSKLYADAADKTRANQAENEQDE